MNAITTLPPDGEENASQVLIRRSGQTRRHRRQPSSASVDRRQGANRRDGHERPTSLLDRGHSGFARLSRRQQQRRIAGTCPRRRGSEHLQVITVVNFKGGSGKTTTAAHLAAISGAARLSGARDRSRSAGQPLRPARLSARIRRRRQRNPLRRASATTINAATSKTSSARPTSPISIWCPATSN